MNLSLTVARGVVSVRTETYYLLAQACADVTSACADETSVESWLLSVERFGDTPLSIRVNGLSIDDVFHGLREPELVRARADEFEIRFLDEDLAEHVHLVGTACELRALIVADVPLGRRVELLVEANGERLDVDGPHGAVRETDAGLVDGAAVSSGDALERKHVPRHAGRYLLDDVRLAGPPADQ